jgi:hypothetical protein
VWCHRGPSSLYRSLTLFLNLLRPNLAILFKQRFSFLIN